MNTIPDTVGNNRRPVRTRIGASGSRWWLSIAILISVPFWSGCAALRPLHGLPARYMPQELQAPSRSGKKTIDLSLLRQTPPQTYRVDSGDVLGVYILNVLGKLDEAPPVYFPTKEEVPPSLGYPTPVRDDGTISLPLSGPISVRGMTLSEVETAIRKSLTEDRQLLNKENVSVFVSLQKPRFSRVLVIRQEAGNELFSGGAPGQFNLGALKRGTGHVVNLPAYRNDVLHALAETGGLPGLDAQNTIYVIRNAKNKRSSRCMVTPPGNGLSPSPIPTQPGFPSAPNASPNSLPPSSGHLGNGTEIQKTGGFGASPGNWGHVVTPAGGFSNTPSVVSLHASAWGHTQPSMSPTPDPTFPSAPNTSNTVVTPTQPQTPPMETYPCESFPQSFGQGMGMDWFGDDTTIENRKVVKIPVRLAPGESPGITEQDVVLEDGDIVFIESRETEIFYTGGLLGGGQFTLPRDYDLDVLGAISVAQSQNANRGGGNNLRAIGGPSALNQDVSVSASHVVVLRQLPNGTQVPIEVDLYRAMRCPEERILIQPGDYIVLQYTPVEAIAAFFERYILEGAVFGVAASQINKN